MKQIKDDINGSRDILYSWVGRISIVKMTILQNQCDPYQIINGIFTKFLEQKIFNLLGNIKGPEQPKQF